MRFTHLSDSERRRIERAIQAEKSVRRIARSLDRSVSSISDEIRINGGRIRYRADRAAVKAKRKRKNSKVQCLKVAMSPSLKKYVIEKMEDEWSPELIAGRLKNEEKDPVAVSAKAIYKFVYSVHGRKIEKLLYSKKHAHKGPKRGSRKPSLDGRTMIDKRPASIDSREEFGHFEGDFIESGRDGKGSLLHLVERKTRYSFLVKVEDRKTIAVNALIAKTLSGVDPLSLTLDNDLSFAKHVALSELLKTSVYFCHAYHSWEKGTVENRNKAVRKDFPKRTDFSLISESAVKETETKLRTRPLKILGFKTPQEAWEKEMLIRASLKVASKTDQDIISTLSTFINIECSD